jgi:hypothetical protein
MVDAGLLTLLEDIFLKVICKDGDCWRRQFVNAEGNVMTARFQIAK